MSLLQYSRTPLIQTLVMWITSYPKWLRPWVKFVKNSTKLTCLEITGYWIKYRSVASRTSFCQCSLFSKKNLIIWILCKSRWLVVPINLDKWSSTIPGKEVLYGTSLNACEKIYIHIHDGDADDCMA